MGKRSNFPRKPRDLYPTPMEAVLPLLPHLEPGTGFDEPCCGDGALIRHLECFGHLCTWASDLKPGGKWTESGEVDVLGLLQCNGSHFITNPPWRRGILHPLILHLSAMAPSWLLLDADWAHTAQASPFLSWCRKIVSVGRVKWEPHSAFTGKDNAAWYLFDQNSAGPTIFVGPIVGVPYGR